MWIHKRSPCSGKHHALSRSTALPSAGKIMAMAFWDLEGILLVDYQDKITGDAYAACCACFRI